MHINLHRHIREVQWGRSNQDGSGQGFQPPLKRVLWFKSMSVCSPFILFFFFFLFPIKFLVEQENEQVDVDGGPVEELHHRHAFILQLEEILIF